MIEKLYRLKGEHKPYAAYCTTVEPVTLRIFAGRWIKDEPAMECKAVVPGTTLKIVMVSRLGDFGLTDNLGAVNGYHLRLPWDTTAVKDFRESP